MPYRVGKKWRGVVMVDRIRTTRLFDTKAEAKKYEVQERKRRENSAKALQDTDLRTLSYKYLDYIQPRMGRKTYEEKQSLCRRLGKTWGNIPLLSISPEMVADYLLDQAKTRSPNASNKDRKNLLAMWNWGRKFLAVNYNPLASIDQLPHARAVQYTPSEDDIAKLIQVATRVEKVFLDCYLQTGARRSEIFRLTWNDINFEAQTVTLWCRKNRRGQWEAQTIDMNDELSSGLQWWRKAPENKYKDEPHVWIDHHPGPNQGKPFKVRRKFMATFARKRRSSPLASMPYAVLWPLTWPIRARSASNESRSFSAIRIWPPRSVISRGSGQATGRRWGSWRGLGSRKTVCQIVCQMVLKRS